MLDPSVKAELLNACRNLVAQQLATATQAMNDAQAAANEEGKSSAGDKYETGRAMMQIERDKAAVQVAEALKLKQVLDQISPDTGSATVSLGSVVITESHRFFVAIGVGKVSVRETEFIVVGPMSPLGKTLLGLRANDTFTFNKQLLTVREIV